MKNCNKLIGRTVFLICDTLRSSSPLEKCLGVNWFQSHDNALSSTLDLCIEKLSNALDHAVPKTIVVDDTEYTCLSYENRNIDWNMVRYCFKTVDTLLTTRELEDRLSVLFIESPLVSIPIFEINDKMEYLGLLLTLSLGYILIILG
jgi:hypothetical protein